MSEGTSSEFIYGRWPVREALESGPVSKLLLAKGIEGKPIDEILQLARQKKVPFLWVDRRKLDQLAGGSHQGVLAQVAAAPMADLDGVWEAALSAPTKGPAVLFLDGITDPQNLGAILRSAVFFGVAGVVLPKWRAASVTAAVVRSSAGAARMIPIAQVSNLPTAMEVAKKKGLWLVGADMSGADAKRADLPRPFALVLGSEGEGLHELVRKKCDVVVSIGGVRRGEQAKRGINSLNVAAACAVLLHQFS